MQGKDYRKFPITPSTHTQKNRIKMTNLTYEI